MRKLTTAFGRFFFACVVLLPLSAHAARLEIGLGIAQSRDHGDGTWYQSAFPHTRNLTSPVAQIGIVGDALPWLRWHVDAVYLGRYSVDSWDTPVDANYNPRAANGCNGECLPLVHVQGAGAVYGVAATLEAHTQGAWQWGVEAGPMLYRASWNLAVPNWQQATGAAGNPQWQSRNGALYSNDAHWALGAVFGVTLTHNDNALALRYYADGKGFSGHGADPWPPIWKGQIVLMFTHAF